MVVYIAGPNMTEKEKKLVEKARTYFEAQDFEVTAMVDELDEWMSKVQYLVAATELIVKADMVCFLEGWRNNDAAQVERSICTYLDKPIRHFT